MKRAALLVLVLVSSWLSFAQRDTQQSRVSFAVVKEVNGKPVRNAGVVLHSVNDKGRQAKGGLELKTDAEGKTSFDGVPYGKLRVQVLAPGFQTFGEDYDITQPETEITVKLKRPQQQFSIYDKTTGAGTQAAPQPEPPKQEQPH